MIYIKMLKEKHEPRLARFIADSQLM